MPWHSNEILYFASQSVRRKCAEMGGSMVSKRLSIFGFISAAGLVSGALIGCGGSSASTSSANPTVQTTGGVTTSSGSATTAAPTSTTPQQVQVNGQTAVVPPGQPAISVGSTVCVIPAGTSFLNGLTPKLDHQATGTVKKLTTAPAGEIFVGYSVSGPWFDTGVSIGANATLSSNLAFAAPATSFLPNYLMVAGPLNITGTAFNGGTLTINNSFILGFVVFADGGSSLPTMLSLKLPADGGTIAGGNFANVTIPTEFVGGVGMRLTWPGVTKSQTKIDTDGTVSISVSTAGGNPTDDVPAGGISSVAVTIVAFGL